MNRGEGRLAYLEFRKQQQARIESVIPLIASAYGITPQYKAGLILYELERITIQLQHLDDRGLWMGTWVYLGGRTHPVIYGEDVLGVMGEVMGDIRVKLSAVLESLPKKMGN
jgi:hypothetical protein